MLVPAGGVTNPTSLINQGMISADVSGRTLNVPANSFQNQGTIQAINGGLLSIAHMSGPVGTALADGAGSQLTLSGTYVNNGSISATNGGLIMLNGSWTNSGVINLDHGTIALSGTVTPAVFTGINNNAGSLRVLGTLLAHGLTFSVPSGSGLDIYGSSAILDASTLVVPAGETLHATQGSLRQGLVTGGGTVTMSDGVISGVLGGIGPLGAVTINSTMTITGSGQINGTTLSNNGLISADVPGHSLTTQASSFTNAGTINILNGAVFGFGDSTVWNNTGTININSGTLSLGGFFTTAGIGTINNTAGTQMQLYGHWDNTGNTLTLPQMQYFSAGEVMGGTLQIPASVNTSGARFDNVTIAGDFNPAGVTILNGLTFSGTAAFPATGGALVFSGAQTVPAGHFTLTSGPNFTSSISGGTLTLGPGVLIEGGRGMLAGSVSLNNQGVIRSNLPGEDIAIAGGNVFNTGTIEAVNGGTLTISNYNQLNAPGDTGLLRVGPGSTLLMQGSYVLAGANLLNDGGSLYLSGTVIYALFTFNLAGSALLTGRISGGTVNVTGGALTFPDGFNSGGTLDGVALNGNVEVNGNNNGTFGRLLTLRNGLTLNGTIHVTGPAAAVIFDNSETYDGGDIFFDSTSPGLRIISATNAGTLVTFGPNAAVHGGAVNILDSLYVPNTSLVNHGHIAADVAGQTLSVRAHSFVNDGLMEALNGGTLNIGGVNDPGGFGATNTWSSTGVIRALPGSTLDLHGRFNTASFLSVQDAGGDVNISGVMNNAGATLSLSGAGASPRLMGGTIQGGSVVVSGTGALQVPLGGSGTLDGVSLAGDMSINGEMDLLNGTSFTGNIRIGDSGKLLVGAVNAAQPYTLSSGTVQFDGAAASILTIPTFGSDNMILGPSLPRPRRGRAHDPQRRRVDPRQLRHHQRRLPRKPHPDRPGGQLRNPRSHQRRHPDRRRHPRTLNHAPRRPRHIRTRRRFLHVHQLDDPLQRHRQSWRRHRQQRQHPHDGCLHPVGPARRPAPQGRLGRRRPGRQRRLRRRHQLRRPHRLSRISTSPATSRPPPACSKWTSETLSSHRGNIALRTPTSKVVFARRSGPSSSGTIFFDPSRRPRAARADPGRPGRQRPGVRNHYLWPRCHPPRGRRAHPSRLGRGRAGHTHQPGPGLRRHHRSGDSDRAAAICESGNGPGHQRWHHHLRRPAPALRARPHDPPQQRNRVRRRPQQPAPGRPRVRIDKRPAP